MASPEEIIVFWFGEPTAASDQNRPLWFQKNADFDALIKSRFEETLNLAANGELDSWVESSPLTALALVIVLDQFPRNMFRGSRRAFEYDSKAGRVAERMVEKGWDRELPYTGRTLVYLVFVHSEDMETQRRVIQLSERMIEEVLEEFKDKARRYRDSVRKHYEIVERFGRYPHRNELLGRESTADELEFLKTNPGF